MSYDKFNKEHAFLTVNRALKSGKPGNPVLLCGVETYLIDWACNEFVNRFTDETVRFMDLAVVDGDNGSLSVLIEACETMPAVSEKKMVIARNIPGIYGKSSKLWTPTDNKILCEYVYKVPVNTELVFVETLRNDVIANKWMSPLVKAIKDTGRVYDLGPLSRGDLIKFINKRLSEGGKIIEPEARDMLINESGYFNREIDYGLYNLENDIQKLIALNNEEEITCAAVEDCVSQNPEHNIFKMLDSISNSRKDEAFRLLYNLSLTGSNVFQLLSTVISQLELMVICKEMRGEGCSMAAMKKELKIHEYRLQKAAGFADKHERASLLNMLRTALKVERNIKYGMLSQEMAMEMMIAEM